MRTPSGAPAAFRALVERAVALSGVPPRLIAAVASVESAWEVGAQSSAGAMGLMQLMPATARALGVDPWDAGENLVGGARYLAAMLSTFDDVGLALAAYNAGPGRVTEALRTGRALPAETMAYVQRVLGRMPALTPKLVSM
jgi:soluble lytic murein transglycosylase-like protein